MGAVWRFYGYQDYPASIPAVCSFKVQSPHQLDFIVRSGKISDLQVYYKRPTKLENFKYLISEDIQYFINFTKVLSNEQQ
jgi:hypothetical protein